MATSPITKLIFIYNANSGMLDAIVDSARKLLRINGCALCAVTHGVAGEKSEWKSCDQALGVPIDYLHKDEIPEGLAPLVEGKLPCVVAEADDREPLILLDAETIERCRGSVQDLRGKLIFWAARANLSLQNVS